MTQLGPVQYSCPSGLVKILVPVFINGRHAGMLLAGPVALHALDAERLDQLADSAGKGRLGRARGAVADDLALQSAAVLRQIPRGGNAAADVRQIFGGSGQTILADRRPRPASPLLKKIEQFLAGCQDGQVSLKAVAASVNLSPCHFCAVFKKQTGLTFSRYRVRQRLAKARELLADSDRRISDVAFESGFESIPYFNRAFRLAVWLFAHGISAAAGRPKSRSRKSKSRRSAKRAGRVQ